MSEPVPKHRMRVVNRHFASKFEIRRCVYVGRPTKWGNPYPMTNDRVRDLVCDKYEHYIATRLINGALTSEDFKEFDGKNLLCFCAPKRCHADTLLKLYLMSHQERLDWANEILSIHS